MLTEEVCSPLGGAFQIVMLALRGKTNLQKHPPVQEAVGNCTIMAGICGVDCVVALQPYMAFGHLQERLRSHC